MKNLTAAILALLTLAAPVCAEESYPSRPITLIVPFAPGGSTDVIGRVVAEGLRQVLGQAVVVENRGGAGGSIGTAAIAGAPPDGYTIGMGTASTLAINPATYKNLPFDVLDDLVPIGKIADVPNIMSINPSLAASDMASFIALARAQPGKLSYASAGIGSVSHLLGEQFKLATGTDIVHVPYRGVAPALTDVVAGQVDVMFDNLPTSLQLARWAAAPARRVRRQTRGGAARCADLRRARARRHELDGVLRAGRTQGHAGYRREETQRGAVAGAGDARGARQARRRSRPSWRVVLPRRSRRRSRVNWRACGGRWRRPGSSWSRVGS